MAARHYPDIPRVYFDMDGVVADFERAARERSMDPAHFKLVAGAYLDLHPVPGALEAVEAVASAGFLVFLLTKPPSANPYAASEKLLWARRHLPALEDRVIITPDKGAVGLPRDFLVDDHPEWANARNFPGTVLQFSGDWAPILEAILPKP